MAKGEKYWSKITGWVKGEPSPVIEEGIWPLEELLIKYEKRGVDRETALKNIRELATKITESGRKHPFEFRAMMDVIDYYKTDLGKFKMAVEWALKGVHEGKIPKSATFYRHTPGKGKATSTTPPPPPLPTTGPSPPPPSTSTTTTSPAPQNAKPWSIMDYISTPDEERTAKAWKKDWIRGRDIAKAAGEAAGQLAWEKKHYLRAPLFAKVPTGPTPTLEKLDPKVRSAINKGRILLQKSSSDVKRELERLQKEAKDEFDRKKKELQDVKDGIEKIISDIRKEKGKESTPAAEEEAGATGEAAT